MLSQHWILDFLRQIGTLVENIKEGTLNLILLKMVLHSPPLVSSNVVLVRRLETGVWELYKYDMSGPLVMPYPAGDCSQ